MLSTTSASVLVLQLTVLLRCLDARVLDGLLSRRANPTRPSLPYEEWTYLASNAIISPLFLFKGRETAEFLNVEQEGASCPALGSDVAPLRVTIHGDHIQLPTENVTKVELKRAELVRQFLDGSRFQWLDSFLDFSFFAMVPHWNAFSRFTTPVARRSRKVKWLISSAASCLKAEAVRSAGLVDHPIEWADVGNATQILRQLQDGTEDAPAPAVVASSESILPPWPAELVKSAAEDSADPTFEKLRQREAFWRMLPPRRKVDYQSLGVVTMILSDPADSEKREKFRGLKFPIVYTGGSFVYKFVMGIPMKPTSDGRDCSETSCQIDVALLEALVEESHKHKDIIMADFPDTTRAAALKNVAAFQWAATHCHGANFVFKTTLDCEVPFPLILSTAERLAVRRIRGTILAEVMPLRSGDASIFSRNSSALDYIPYSMHPYDGVPSSPKEGSALYSMDVVNRIAEMAAFGSLRDIPLNGVWEGIAAMSLSTVISHWYGKDTPCEQLLGRCSKEAFTMDVYMKECKEEWLREADTPRWYLRHDLSELIDQRN